MLNHFCGVASDFTTVLKTGRWASKVLACIPTFRYCKSSLVIQLYKSSSGSMNVNDHSLTVVARRQAAHGQALLRVLKTAGVKYIRYQVMDAANNPRVKTVPLSYLQRQGYSLDNHQIQIASICIAGLPSFGDVMQTSSGLDARGTVVFEPDLATLRVLPYAPASALLLGNLRDLQTGDISDLCARSLLQRVVEKAAREHKLGFCVGAEVEFSLFQAETHQPVDATHFAHNRILNEQQAFLTELHDQLVEHQDIPIELVHAESASGQVEVVLQYCRDPVELADRVVLVRETISSLAQAHGMKALFLPKIRAMEAGNGCHLHLSMYDIETGENLFGIKQSKDDIAPTQNNSANDISAVGQSFMEGILANMSALLALTLPTTNSFRRVGKGCWTGSTVNWSFDDKEAPMRVVANAPAHVGAPARGWGHFEYKLCDNTANLYLALAGILACGLHGVSTKASLRPHRFQLSATGDSDVALPASAADALNLFEKNESLRAVIPEPLFKGYLSIRRAEVERGLNMTLDEEVQEALARA